MAVTLDTGTAVQTVADLAIPRLADACLVDVVQPDGSLRRVASSWQKKTLTPALDALAALSLDWDSPAAVIDVMRRGVAESAAVDDDWLDAHEEPVAAAHYIDHRGR